MSSPWEHSNVDDEAHLLSDVESDSERLQPSPAVPIQSPTIMVANTSYCQVLSASKRQQRHLFYYIVASVLLVIPLVLWALSLRSSSKPQPQPSFPAGGSGARGSHCAAYPSDCVTTAPFIFDSVYSLAKQWPNTYAPNGHSVVPVTFPRNIPLYHAEQRNGVLKKPTWFAFDAEMSLGIYGGSGNTNLHTVVPARPLQLLYFDGESATLTTTGSLDSQTAILRNWLDPNPSYNFTYDEDQRGNELCKLAAELGIDGFMRMNAGFEVLACDIDASGMQQVLVRNVTVPGNYVRENDPSLPQDPNRRPPLGFGNIFAPEYSWDWIRSATWHYGKYGNGDGSKPEHRVTIDICRMLTFYDPMLHSLSGRHVGGIQGKEHYENGWGLRRGHRLLGISSEDTKTMRAWIEDVLSSTRQPSWWQSVKGLFKQKPACSGSPWQVITEVITDSHRSRAMEILGAFHQHKTGDLAVGKLVEQVHELSHAILAPFFQYPGADEMSVSRVKEDTITGCSTLFTAFLHPAEMNEYEYLLKDSIQIVLEKLCHWEWDLFEWSENHTTDLLRRSFDGDYPPATDPSTEEIMLYQRGTEETMQWLGWSDWVDCPKKCDLGELCYIPMWPVIYSNGTRQGSIYAGSKLTKQEEEYFWSPKCISREMFAKAGGRGREPEYQFPDVPGNGGDSDH